MAPVVAVEALQATMVKPDAALSRYMSFAPALTVHARTHARRHARTQTRTHSDTNACTHTRTDARTQTHTLACSPARLLARSPACLLARSRAMDMAIARAIMDTISSVLSKEAQHQHACARMHARMHACTGACAWARTRTCAQANFWSAETLDLRELSIA